MHSCKPMVWQDIGSSGFQALGLLAGRIVPAVFLRPPFAHLHRLAADLFSSTSAQCHGCLLTNSGLSCILCRLRSVGNTESPAALQGPEHGSMPKVCSPRRALLS